MAVGAGLLTTLQTNSNAGHYLGYQVLVGAGGGVGCQQAFTAIGAVMGDADVPLASSLIIFAQMFGSTIFVLAAESVFTNSLVAGLQQEAPGLDPASVLDIGATSLRDKIDSRYIDVAIAVYNSSITKAFILATALASLAMVGALRVEWKSVKRTLDAEKEKSDGQSGESL